MEVWLEPPQWLFLELLVWFESSQLAGLPTSSLSTANVLLFSRGALQLGVSDCKNVQIARETSPSDDLRTWWSPQCYEKLDGDLL